jgi:hypothetical protein
MSRAPPQNGALSLGICNRRSAGPNVRCLLTFSTRRRSILYRLAFLQRFESLSSDLGMMNEQIFTAVIRSDEAEALLLVEPLDCSSGHFFFSLDPQGLYNTFPQLRIRGMLRGRKVYSLTELHEFYPPTGPKSNKNCHDRDPGARTDPM